MTETESREVQDSSKAVGHEDKAKSMAEELEEMFKNRYTDEDEEYTRTVTTDLAKPPCVENWYTRPKRSFDWARGRGGGGGGGGYRGHGGGQRDYRDNRDNRDNRGWDRNRSDRRPEESYDHRGYGQQRGRHHHGPSRDQHGHRDRVYYPGGPQRDQGEHRDRYHPYGGNRGHQERKHDSKK